MYICVQMYTYEDLKTKLTADEASEQKVYDKYACWCSEISRIRSSPFYDPFVYCSISCWFNNICVFLVG